MRTPHPKRSAAAPPLAPAAVADRAPGAGHNNPPSPIEPMVLRVPQAARVLAMSTRKVWSLIADGQLDARRSGGVTLVLMTSIRAFLDGAKDPPRQVPRPKRDGEGLQL